jgi:hypothetical protein
MNAIDQKPTKVLVHVLTQEQYKQLEQRALSKITFRDETSATAAGYLAGVHEVLKLVRDGFSVA